MKQFITNKNLYIIQGNVNEVMKQLKELSIKYKTIKELLDFYSKSQ